MDHFAAMAMGNANRGKPMMVFDWDKAARLIRERRPHEAGAGLRSDWEYTGGKIYGDGQPVLDDYTYLASTWAVPELSMDGELVPCFIMEDDMPEEWGDDCAKVKWPESALKILRGE